MEKDPKIIQTPTGSSDKSAPNRVKNKNASIDKRQVLKFLIWVVIFGAVVLVSVAGGAFAGYQSGMQSLELTATLSSKASVAEQFTLAVQDIAEGRLEVANRRLEFVISQDPAYPGAAEKLAEVMVVLYATATPTQLPPTITPTTTRDPRPVEEMFQHALSLAHEQKWTEALDLLVSLRKEDLAYQTAKVDGLMFISLRMRGFEKIWKFGDLNAGIYDLVLASKFGPLDTQANSARDLARLYLIGSSFWEVDPAQAITYFSQVAAAAPGLQDTSGWTASARYREVLIQYGDKLAASQDWCAAQQQYELALSMGADAALQEKTRNVSLQCTPPTGTAAPTAEIPTETPIPGITDIPPTTQPPTNTVDVQPPTDTLMPTDIVVSPTNTSEPPPVETVPPAAESTALAPYP
jgi:hypothetical protein